MSVVRSRKGMVYDPAYPQDCLLDVYLPEKDGPCPVFVYFHGGGLEAGDRRIGESILNLVEDGFAVVSADYRMYPNAKFPDYLEDAAKAIAWTMNFGEGNTCFDRVYVGGSSAGAYLSMMLYFDKRYLGKHGISPDGLAGYVFDAGQPTVHFNVLRERGIDTRAIRVDEAAPMYFIDKPIEKPELKPRILVLAAEDDMVCRLEQTHVLLKTMESFGYDQSRVTFRFMKGFSHCGYIDAVDDKNDFVYYHILRDFLK